jgi:hypothetical protein
VACWSSRPPTEQKILGSSPYKFLEIYTLQCPCHNLIRIVIVCR